MNAVPLQLDAVEAGRADAALQVALTGATLEDPAPWTTDEPLHRAGRRPLRRRHMLQEAEGAAGSQDATDLGEHGPRIRHRAEHQRRDHHVGAAVGQTGVVRGAGLQVEPDAVPAGRGPQRLVHVPIRFDGDQGGGVREVAQVGAHPGTDLDHPPRQSGEHALLVPVQGPLDVRVEQTEERSVEPAADGVLLEAVAGDAAARPAHISALPLTAWFESEVTHAGTRVLPPAFGRRTTIKPPATPPPLSASFPGSNHGRDSEPGNVAECRRSMMPISRESCPACQSHQLRFIRRLTPAAFLSPKVGTLVTKDALPVMTQSTRASGSPTSEPGNFTVSVDEQARYKAQTAEVAAALEVWKKGLLTVSGASRLVNYKPTKSRSVTIDSPGADEILRRLAVGGDWIFAGTRDEDAGVAAERPGPTSATAPAALQCSIAHKDIGPVVRSIMRQANTEWLDRGLHVLYLALGLLEWRDVDNTPYVSPLILVPVDLIPLGPKDVPRLTSAEDDPLLNPALRVQLSKLGIELPVAEELEDLDVRSQLAAVQEAVASKSGWRVKEHAVLAMFSFHKEAMYKDLVDNAEAIVAHPVVRMLGTSDPLKQAAGLGFEPIDPEDIDRLAPPETTPVVLDADSSQRTAIAAAVEGRSFVMDGPPGTGKSQTIANMIGALMYAGKSVLFVSEKAAALEVVRNRLELVGLQPYLLELHSSKTSRKDVALELWRSLETKPVPPTGMSEHDRQSAATHREQLNSYSAAMNELREPLKHSLHDILGRVAKIAEAPHVPIPPTGSESITSEDYWQFKEVVKTLHLSWRPAQQGASFLWRDAIERAPIDERIFAVRNALDDLRAAFAVNATLSREYAITVPSDAPKLARLLDLQHEKRPAGVPDSWLTAESLGEIEAIITALHADILALVQADEAWMQSAGSSWQELTGFASLKPADALSTNQGFETEVLTADGCVALAGKLESLAAGLERSLTTSTSLALTLGLPAPRSFRDVERVLGLTGLASATERPLPEWFVRGTVETGRLLGALEASVQNLNRIEYEARPYFTDAALHAPVDELLNRFRKEHRGLKKLGSAYRADRRSVSTILANDVAVAEGIRGLEKAVAWARANFEYEAEAQSDAQAIGSYWLGRQTEFDRAKRALSIVDRAWELLGGLPMNPDLVAHLATDAGLSLQGPASEVAYDLSTWRQSFGGGGVLERHQALLMQPIADVVTWLRAHAIAATHTAARTRVVDVALERLHTSQDAERLVRLWITAGNARTVLDSKAGFYGSVFGPLFSGANTDLTTLSTALRWAREVRSERGAALSVAQADVLSSSRPSPRLVEAIRRWDLAIESLLQAFAEGRRHDLRLDLDDFDGAAQLTAELESDAAGQAEWFRYVSVRKQFARLGLDQTVSACLEQKLPTEDVPAALEKALLRGWANHIMASDSRITPQTTAERQALIDRYRSLDKELIHSAHSRIIHAVNSRRPQFLGMGEQGVIQREGMKKRRHIPVRDLLAKTKSTALTLKPCFMMSPLAVSQYLPADIRFDVVIFDEASQVTPSDAINCVYRGNALILAGDDKQLPPTSFFEKMDEGEMEQEESDVNDFQSILELAKASGSLRSLPLRWHYRSTDDALINYSNYKFYEGKLIVFPGPGSESGEAAVSFHRVEGVYRRGATADNPIEAAAVAARVLDHYTRTPEQTLGVVTFSVAQASAVQDAIDKAREIRRDLDQHFDKAERLHAFFVKSLESVQGDERDKIIFSIGYGPDENGKTTANFGVLNRDKGWRRLNVAITRARKKVEVVSSIGAGDLPPSSNENVEYLRSYLDYAERGMPALAINLGSSNQSPDSPFEESVLGVLTQWGYAVEPQVGSAGYRIDIGVRHPLHPGLFLLGIECDGYQYHSAPAARDRDRLREAVLRGLGWNLHRIWGTAWYRDRDGEESRLQRALERALSSTGETTADERRAAVALGFENVELVGRPGWAREYVEAAVPRLPRWIDVSEPGAGFDMAEGVLRVVESEGPVHIEVLYQRLRDAWSIGRIGVKIRENIESAIRHSGVSRNGDFLTIPGTNVEHVRTPSASATRRVDQIHPAELGLAMRLLLTEMGSASSEQLTTATARLFGWARIGPDIQNRLESILGRLLESGRIRRQDGVLSPPG